MVAAALLFSFAGSLVANERLSMAVSPAQSFAPTTLTVRLHVDADSGNRALEVVAESIAYYRSSVIPLDGASAPRTISFEMRNVPGGEYDVTGYLIDSAGNGRATVRQHVIVIDSADRE